MKIVVATPVGRTELGDQIDYFPSRWSGNTGQYKSTSFYPFNLAYLSALLKRDTSHSVRMIDMNYYGVDSDEYIDIIIKAKPDLLIVEVDAIIYNKQLKIFKELKSRLPELKILACGPQPTATPEHTLANGVDYVALREFEQNIVRFIKSDFNKEAQGIYPNPSVDLIDLNTLPFPENEDVSRRSYCRYYGSEYNEIEMWATRGCPVMCNFCVVANVYSGKANHRVRSVKSVIEEIKYLQKNIPDMDGIFFNDESHTINKKFIKQLCRAIIDEGINKQLKFNCMCNYDTLDRELLSIMKEAGYYKVRIGLESLEESTMQHISKYRSKSNLSRLLDVLHNCRELGIKVYGTISVGTVGSTFEKDIESFNTIEKLHREGYVQEFQLSINTPLQGTPFYDRAKSNGWLIDTKSNFDGTYGSMVNLPDYPAEKVDEAFAYGEKLRAKLNEINVNNGVRYSSYDKQWCAPVYATSNRVIGKGVL